MPFSGCRHFKSSRKNERKKTVIEVLKKAFFKHLEQSNLTVDPSKNQGKSCDIPIL